MGSINALTQASRNLLTSFHPQSLACNLKAGTTTSSPNFPPLSPPLTSEVDIPQSKNTLQPSPTSPSIVSMSLPPRCLTPLHTSKYPTSTLLFLPISTPWRYPTLASLYATFHQAYKFYIYGIARGFTKANRPSHSKYNFLPHLIKSRFGELIINP